jgi:AraC-like DNA-binding protein/mannose-6-phosphate isomerase-like protein (cupin superfamily)
MDAYKDIYKNDDTGICAEHWVGASSVEMHKHAYIELFIIEKGSCKHFYDHRETLLIPGDCFLVPAHHEHGFEIHKPSSIFNCQFFTERLRTDDIRRITHELCAGNSRGAQDCSEFHGANINKQGIYHFEPDARLYFFTLTGHMLDEQNKAGVYFQEMKRNYLETILILLKRVCDQQYSNYIQHPSPKHTKIMKVLSYIEANIAEEEVFDFKALADQNNVSPNHFRKLFKDFTGLSPVEYINRLRIVKACDQLLKGEESILDVAAGVGIYDSNYFSRMFKQYIGCSPKQYKPSKYQAGYR